MLIGPLSPCDHGGVYGGDPCFSHSSEGGAYGAVMGGDSNLYENDKKLIAAAGLDPSTYQSGKYAGKSRLSKRGNRHLRRVIWLMAQIVVFCNGLFRAYFYKRRREGLPYKMAVLATAHTLIRVMFAMLVHQT